MTNTELLILAENLGHHIFFADIPESKSISIYDGECYIGVDYSVTAIEEKVLLAHELGHCEHGGFYDRLTPKITRKQIEYRAHKWSYCLLIPPEAVKQAMRGGITDAWDLAEYFDVPCEYMYKALIYYKESCGVAFDN